MILAFAAAVAVALIVAAAVAWLIARNARRFGVVDIPNSRSSHDHPTPRGGGVGIITGVGAGILVLAAVGMPPGRDLGLVMAGCMAIAALGALDDLFSVVAPLRLFGQLVVAVVVVMVVGGVSRLPLPPPLDLPLGLLAAPLTVVWLTTAANFYNFMDGIDGLAGGQAVASCVGISIASWSQGAVEFAVVLAAASIGFLVLNFPRARVFLGDVGSTSLGFALAALPLLAPPTGRPMAVFAVAIGLSLFLLDPMETLFRLIRAGRRLGVAHRWHSYQLLSTTRDRRTLAAISLVSCGFVLSVGGGLAYREHSLAWPLVALGVSAYAIERFLAGRSKSLAK